MTVFRRHSRIAVDHIIQNLGVLSILRTGFISNVIHGAINSPSPTDFLHVAEAQRRIWAELKYRDDRPVLMDMVLIRRPSRRIFMDIWELRRSGRRAQTIKQPGMGEIAVALKLNLEGEVICRAR
ncbi:hypothetical protein K503DRAFT_848971 [Rhizopogon vinicolor AM-OR11-026]|uniref:Uncharacterized protein n=1 Tax=Rhizopogon vinicolor AM-OR11-026 TaxID=1314800 RepID=A0A1B7N6I4_9AGAM|nr:hypothetical protein K503DRAFT_848971 [Rhizopogon vinicolor AM-OR11-026]